MTELTIIINGLEYEPKNKSQVVSDLLNKIKELEADVDTLEKDLCLASFEDEKKQCIINDLQEEVELQADSIDKQIGEIQALSFQINDLEQTIADLEEENGLTMSKFNELEEALNDIHYTVSRFI
jgi:chromosome segregation ATPase